MKKIIATALCVTLATPCFATGRYQNYYPQPNYNNRPYYQYEMEPHHKNYHKKHHSCTSKRTRTIGTIAGIAGIALLISAIAD